MADSSRFAGSAMPPELRGQMAGEYRLGRKLGEGGFGAVYEAEHPVLKRRAAVKVLHRVADKDSEAVQRFIAEAQAVHQVHSPYIVDVFSFGTLQDGRHFYVMDLLEGEPLDAYLARVGRIDVATALQLLRPIAEALDAVHAAGIVHRDLKPQNIFLAWDANSRAVPKLLDFGMAKLLGDVGVNTVSGTPMGTPLYMSPEQARGQKVDHRSDVYALGVLCHELLTGHLPFTGDTAVAVLMAHITEEPRRVSGECPDLPSALDDPILRMLEKPAERRPDSAGAALLALSRAAEEAGYPVSDALPSLPRPASPTDTGSLGLLRTLAANSPPAASASGAQSAASTPRKPPRTRASLLGGLALGALSVAGAASYWARGDSEAGGADAQSPAAREGAAPPPGAAPERGVPIREEPASGAASAELPRVSDAAVDGASPAASERESVPPAPKKSGRPARVRAKPNAPLGPPAGALRRPAPAASDEAIPSDLENPF